MAAIERLEYLFISMFEEKTDEADVGYMRKLVKPADLRTMMSAMLAQKLQAKYMPDKH